MSIEVKGLTKKFGEQIAVNEVSFSIKQGEIVGFLGPNGAGKSTTMKMLTCFIPPTSGEAWVCGKNISEESLEVRKRIGYLPEHNPLYLDMYMREYLMFTGELGGTKNLKQRVDEVIELTNLGVEKNKKLGQLSKGYRQRVGLAQAMIHDPEVLILDEPTSGLDPNQVIEIRDLIKSLGMTKTIMLSTHIMQEVEAICDRVIIIDKGNIVADDTLQNLRAGAKGRTRVRVQFASAISEKQFKGLEGLEKAEKINEHTWLLSSDREDFRQSLSRFALSENLEILEMNSEKNSLENIFIQLTRNVDHL